MSSCLRQFFEFLFGQNLRREKLHLSLSRRSPIILHSSSLSSALYAFCQTPEGSLSCCLIVIVSICFLVLFTTCRSYFYGLVYTPMKEISQRRTLFRLKTVVISSSYSILASQKHL